MTSTDTTAHTFLYARVSTTDQTIAHQRHLAEAAGFAKIHALPMALAQRVSAKGLQ